MDITYRDKLVLIGEWYDENAGRIRSFTISYYIFDDTIEMFDNNTRKPFMRRIKVQGVTRDMFFIGASVYIFGRLIKIIDGGCEDTRRKLKKTMQPTFALIKPVESILVGKILTEIESGGFKITKMKKVLLKMSDFEKVFRHELKSNQIPFLMKHLVDEYVIGMELVAEGCFDKWHKLMGNSDPLQAEPGTIRKKYGIDLVENCVHGSDTLEDAIIDLEFFFPSAPLMTSDMPLTATLTNCTLCIIKPHAVTEKKIGAIMECIDVEGFHITAINMLHVVKMNAQEFLEVYKGIVNDYKGMVEELVSGPCVAMEIVSKDSNKNTPVEFRKLCGPSDPDIAKLLRPNTLRAKFGTNRIKNAVHCSDLPEDGLLEVEYFFKILEI